MQETTVRMVKRLELWPIENLKPYERNARTHSEEQINQIAASMVQFGFNAPILVDGEQGITAGHGRLEAAKILKLKQVPVVVLDHLRPDEKRAYLIADNKIAENAGWDRELLGREITDLNGQDFDLASLGFSDQELAEILKLSSENENEQNTFMGEQAEESLEGQVRKVTLFYKAETYEDLMERATEIIHSRGISDMSELFEFLVQKEYQGLTIA